MTKAIRWTPQQLTEYELTLGRKLKLAKDKPAEPEKKKGKYNNRGMIVNGIMFDSHREGRRWCELLDLQREGKIKYLVRQVTFMLAPAVHMEGNARKTPALRYVADFMYVTAGELVVEDAKGMKTRPYLQKKHLMKTVHGIDIREV